LLAVRLKLRIRVGDRAVEAVALLNSGYEAPTPQLLILVSSAYELGLWPPTNVVDVELDTVGGPLRAWFYPRIALLKVLAEDANSNFRLS